VETQQKKDSFKQMLLDEMRLHDVDDVAVVEEESQSNAEKKQDFYDYEESITTDTIESEGSKCLFMQCKET